MNEFVAVITALVGTSGVASILAGGTQFRRTHRLRAQLKELDESKQLVAPESKEHYALQAAVATLALELAAYVLIKRDSRRLVLVGIIATSAVGAYLLTAGVTGPGSFEAWFFAPLGAPQDLVMAIAGLIIFMSGYTAIFIYVYLGITARQRQRFIWRLLKNPDQSDTDSILRLSHHLNYHQRQLLKALRVKAKTNDDNESAVAAQGR